jgi:hypothetical protein
MKQFIFLCFVTALFIGCKRKQELRDLTGKQVLAQGLSTCYNGIQDGDETAVDCGGSCNACTFPTAPCTPTVNTIKIGTSTYIIYPNPPSSSGGNISFTGSYSGGISYYLELGTGSSNPDLTKTYTINTNVSVSSGHAYSYLTTSSFSFADFQIISGNVYITKTGNVYYATICNAVGKYVSNPATYAIEASIAYQ